MPDPSTASYRPDPLPTQGPRRGQPMRTGPRSGGPNYFMRRVGAIGAAVAVVAVSVIVIGRSIGGNDGRSSAGEVEADWNRVVVLTEGAINVIDPASGEIDNTYPVTTDLLDDQSLTNGPMLVTMTDFGRIGVHDLTDGSIRRGQTGSDETMLRSRDHPDLVFVGSDVGGDLTVIDLSERDILSVADRAGLDSPLMFAAAARANPGGTHVAVSDGRSFQTIVVDIAEQAAIPVAGQIVAINDSVVVTAQRAGATTELEFYDLTGERLGSVDVPTPIATMLTDDDEVVTVDATGAIRIAAADGVSDEGQVTVPNADPDADPDVDDIPATPSSGVETASNTRLVVTDDTDTFVIDDRGEQLLFSTGVVTSPVSGPTICANVGGGFGATSTIVDLDRGRVLADLDGLLVSLTSVDGCTASLLGAGTVVDDEPRVFVDVEGTGTLVWHDGDLVEILGDSVAAIAPDGSSAAVADGETTVLVDLNDGDGLPLAAEPVVVHFAKL